MLLQVTNVLGHNASMIVSLERRRPTFLISSKSSANDFGRSVTCCPSSVSRAHSGSRVNELNLYTTCAVVSTIRGSHPSNTERAKASNAAGADTIILAKWFSMSCAGTLRFMWGLPALPFVTNLLCREAPTSALDLDNTFPAPRRCDIPHRGTGESRNLVRSRSIAGIRWGWDLCECWAPRGCA